MPRRFHLIAGLLAPPCIATFSVSTILTELSGSQAAVALLKSLIFTPGLWIMIPLMGLNARDGLRMAAGRLRTSPAAAARAR